MAKLQLYSIFHLNLAYSSIPEEKLPDIVKRYYWSLLSIVEKTDAKIGIEASGYTLEKIKEIDPTWIEKLKELIEEEKCEFIGSGYMQIIGPAVPALVNKKNFCIGNEVYEELLGIKPTIAYVNEQAYSRSLIEHYLDAGYEAIVMEWNNPRTYHPEWKDEWRYHPQIVKDSKGRSIKVIWNDSTAFQKFQRYAIGELTLKEYKKYLDNHRGKTKRFFPLYGSDAEIFDFKTGRYYNDESLIGMSEWKRILKVFKDLFNDDTFVFVFPSDVIKGTKSRSAFNVLQLESSEQPIPVKKREMFNITRWTLAGRDNVGINTKCFELYNSLMKCENSASDYEKVDALWKELCFLWGSDFRTYIEKEKFKKFKTRLQRALERSRRFNKTKQKQGNKNTFKEVNSVTHNDRDISIKTPTVDLILNAQKGLAVESLIFKKISKTPVIGTLHNGYYNDVTLSEDFFSGHTVVEKPLTSKITDLEQVNIQKEKTRDTISVLGIIKTSRGVIKKRITVFKKESRVDFDYSFNLHDIYPSSFRTAIMTFNPEAFDDKSLYYASHNGGHEKEHFSLGSCERVSCNLISHLVSSRSALGNTEGELEIGDRQKTLFFKTNMNNRAVQPMIDFLRTSDKKKFYMRLLYSLGEYNETSLLNIPQKSSVDFNVSLIGERDTS